MTRKRLPDRRRSWTQKVKIEGQSFYLTCGEYEDGTLGEIWIDCGKEGTFIRGLLGALARTASIALQCGSSVQDVAYSMRHLCFPPQGHVEGSSSVQNCSSVTDWVAQEIEAAYVNQSPPPVPPEGVANG